MNQSQINTLNHYLSGQALHPITNMIMEEHKANHSGNPETTTMINADSTTANLVVSQLKNQGFSVWIRNDSPLPNSTSSVWIIAVNKTYR